MEVMQPEATPGGAVPRSIEVIEAEAASWVGILNAATAALVELVAEALEGDRWAGFGITSPEHWAALRFGLSRARAARLVAAARALRKLPQTAAAFAAGELSEDQVAAIVRAQVPASLDEQVCELARNLSVPQLTRAAQAMAAQAAPAQAEEPPDAPDAADGEQPAQHDARRLVSMGFRDDGTWRLTAVLPAHEGALVDKSLAMAHDRLFRARYGDDADPALRQRIALSDALVHLAQVGLDALDPATRNHPGRMPTERYLVNLHVRADAPHESRIHLGPALPKAVRRELSCDGLVRTWVEHNCGTIGLGRTSRVVDAKLRTALEWRDGTCRVPGCGQTRWLHAHHIVHWEDGGKTELHNLALVCQPHHRAIHRGELHVEGDANHELRWRDARDRPVRHRPPPPPARPVTEVVAGAGLRPRWRNRSGERVDWRYVAWLIDPSPRRTRRPRGQGCCELTDTTSPVMYDE
ncbi:MAG TPA: DUF222 domain-containing protein [Acidimicrobiales bacterium]